MKRIATPDEFFDLISEMGAGKFVTIGYVTDAKLNYPKVQRRNPETGRMKGYNDFETFGREIGVAGDISGVMKLTSYKLNWSTPDTFAKNYKAYKNSYNDIRNRYGIGDSENKDGYTQRQEYGKNDVQVYQGKNDDIKDHSYTQQNVKNAKRKSKYYLIGSDGHIMREIDSKNIVNYFKPKSAVTGVAALRKIGADDAKIEAYINEMESLNFQAQTFESSHILYMAAAVGGEKFVYINDRMTQSVEEVNVDTGDFIQLAQERYSKDLEELKEAVNRYNGRKNAINESFIFELVSRVAKRYLNEVYRKR